MAVTVKKEKGTKPVVIQNFVTARPPQRTQFDIATWRRAIQSAEMEYEPNRVELYDIYEDALLDPHLSRQWEKRVENITNTKWLFVNEKGEEVPEITTLIATPEFEEVLKESMKTVGWGITLLEFGKETKPVMGESKNCLKVYSVPRKHIRPDKGTIVIEQYDSSEGSRTIRYREGQYANYIAEMGTPANLGILLNVAPYVILKKGGVSDWALFVQLFGQPFREYRYNGYDEAVRIQLEKSAQEMSSAPYIILPDGSQLTLHEIRNNNTGEVHGKLVDYCDKMISIRILGNTLTTDNTKVGSNALGEVHQETQDEVFAADKQTITRILNDRIAPILYNLGFPVKGGSFKPKEKKNLAYVKDRLSILKQVKELGEPIDSDTIYQDADVAKPKEYDKLKADMEAKADAEVAEKAGATGGGPGRKVPKAKKLSLIDQLFDFFD